MSDLYLEIKSKSDPTAITKMGVSLKALGDQGKTTGSRISSSIGGAAVAFAGLIAAAGLAKLALDNLIVDPLQESMFMQTATLRMETFTGSATEATRRMASLAKFADSTPFELNELVGASQQMLAYGGSALATEANLRKIGDAAALVGAPIDNLSMHFGRAYAELKAGKPIGETMARLRELGLAVPGVSDTIEKMQKQGASFSATWDVFSSQFDKASGAMEKLAGTASGQISTLKDTISAFKRNIGESGPLQTFQLALGELITTTNHYNKETDLAAEIGLAVTKTFFGMAQGALTLQRAWIVTKDAGQRASSALILQFAQIQHGWALMERDLLGGGANVVKMFYEMSINMLKAIQPIYNKLGMGDAVAADLEIAKLGVLAMSWAVYELDDKVGEASKSLELATTILKDLSEIQEKANMDAFNKSMESSNALSLAMSKVLKEVADKKKALADLNSGGIEIAAKETDVTADLTKAHRDLIESLENELLAAKVGVERFGQSETAIKAWTAVLKLGRNAGDDFKETVQKLVAEIEAIQAIEKTRDAFRDLNTEVDAAITEYTKLTNAIGRSEAELFQLYVTELRLKGVSEAKIQQLIIEQTHYTELNKAWNDANALVQKNNELLQDREGFLSDWVTSFGTLFASVLDGGEDNFAGFMQNIVSMWQQGIEQFKVDPESFGGSKIAAAAFGENGQKGQAIFAGLANIYSSNQQHGRGSHESQGNALIQGGATGAQVGGAWGAAIGLVIGAFAGGLFTGGEWHDVGATIGAQINTGILSEFSYTRQRQADGAFLGAFGNDYESINQAMPDSIKGMLIAGYESIKSELAGFGVGAGLAGAQAWLDSFNRSITIELGDAEEGQEAEFIAQWFRNLENEMAKGILPFAELFRRAGEDYTATLARLAQIMPTATEGFRILGLNVDNMTANLVNTMTEQLRENFITDAIRQSTHGGKFPEDVTEQDATVFTNQLNTEALSIAAAMKFKEMLIGALGGVDLAGEKFTLIAETFRDGSELAIDAVERAMAQTQESLTASLAKLGVTEEDLLGLDLELFDPANLAIAVNAQAALAQMMAMERELAMLRGEAIQLDSLTLDQRNLLIAQTEKFNVVMDSLGSNVQFAQQAILDFAAILGTEFEDKLKSFYSQFGGQTGATASGLAMNSSILAGFEISIEEVLNSQGRVLVDAFEAAYASGNTALAAAIVEQAGPAAQYLLDNLQTVSEQFDRLGISIQNVDLTAISDAFGSIDNFSDMMATFQSSFPQSLPDLTTMTENALREALFYLGINLEDAVSTAGGSLSEVLQRAINAGNMDQVYTILSQIGPALADYLAGLTEEERIKVELAEAQRVLNEALTVLDAAPIDPAVLQAVADAMGIDLASAARLLGSAIEETLSPAQRTAMQLEAARAAIEEFGFSADVFATDGTKTWQEMLIAALALGEGGAELVARLLGIKGAVQALDSAAGDAATGIGSSADEVANSVDELESSAASVASVFSRMADQIAAAVSNINAIISRINSSASVGDVGGASRGMEELYALLSPATPGMTMEQIEAQIQAVTELGGLIEDRYNNEIEQIYASAQAQADAWNEAQQAGLERIRAEHAAAQELFQAQMERYRQLQSFVETINNFVGDLSTTSTGGLLESQQLINVEALVRSLLPDVLNGEGNISALTEALSRWLALSASTGGSPARDAVMAEILDIQAQIAAAAANAPMPQDPGELHLPQITEATAGTFLNTTAIKEAQERANEELRELRQHLIDLETERAAREQEAADAAAAANTAAVERDKANVTANQTAAADLTQMVPEMVSQNESLRSQLNLMQAQSDILSIGFDAIVRSVEILTNVLNAKDFSPTIKIVSSAESSNGSEDLG